ncbi:hypothetical protein BZA05DRAFT_447812 [Tricharina praecox]|uniref:uncharacterized protein n=1 Tax=Tricharina praecox TaxID=43433 RepID=UPI00221E5EF8|nr:uncharacterized protein BZA05DRAFT_447812 [Tricharina praecox]KAI5845484.1 hypothetical protein BZA05DRAFT_447812 [Tricharina praecox]
MQIHLRILPILCTIAAVVSAAPSGILPRSGSVSTTSNNKANEPAGKCHMIEFPHFEIPGIDDAITNPEHKQKPAPVVYTDPSSNSTFNYYNSADENISTLVCETTWASPTYDEIAHLISRVLDMGEHDFTASTFPSPQPEQLLSTIAEDEAEMFDHRPSPSTDAFVKAFRDCVREQDRDSKNVLVSQSNSFYCHE